MRCHLISDNTDTLMGMRLAGVSGEIAHNRDETLAALRSALRNQEIAAIFLTQKLSELCEAEVRQIKQTIPVPLLVVIPDRHGGQGLTASMTRYLEETVGIHI
ncbi:MAG: V-type ATP synthase subunit F [Oscillospiraceae bacterium]|nr:V-type ATP synthase subunit F [Oscillospiraceae bacterium]